MIKRYEIKVISDIWSDKNKFTNWLKIEILNCQFLLLNNVISKNIFLDIKNQAKFNINNIYELEKTFKHDVIAFIKEISQHIKNNSAKKWIHYGLTSTDIVDTANAIAFKKTNDIILKNLLKLLKSILQLALKHKYTFQIGRTHGMHAEPITFGFKLIGWYDELKRLIERFNFSRQYVEQGKISGVVGTYANTSIKLQDFICKKLKINSAKYSTQVLSRDNHSFYFATLNNIALSIEKFAITLRHLNITEINEVCEAFSLDQKGSSAMPHKKNPIVLENICGLCRLVEGYSNTINKNVALWHERDISHSSNERVIFLDCATVIVNIISKFNDIIQKMTVNKKQMESNLYLSNDKIFSQRILIEAIKKMDLSRDQIYDLVQKMVFDSVNNNISLKTVFLQSELANFFTKEEINDIFNVHYYIKYIDDIFKRVLNE